MDTIRRCGEAADLLVSVCTGSLLLAAAGFAADVAARLDHDWRPDGGTVVP